MIKVSSFSRNASRHNSLHYRLFNVDTRIYPTLYYIHPFPCGLKVYELQPGVILRTCLLELKKVILNPSLDVMFEKNIILYLPQRVLRWNRIYALYAVDTSLIFDASPKSMDGILNVLDYFAD